ncbi:hypothetical protein KI387_029459, partial [Taxus chinensis]
MGRAPCCDKNNVKKGPWTAEEDAKLLAYITMHGTGLNRCGKSCRLRWTNYLRPDLKHERFTVEEEQLILNLHAAIGSSNVHARRWSLIAAQLPGRTDNDVKNHWNTRLRKKLCEMGIDPVTHRPISQILADYAGNVGVCGGNQGQVAKARISCLTKDLRNTHSQSSNNNPHHPNAVPVPTMDNAHYSPDYNKNLWDVITQLNAIKGSVATADQSMVTNQFSCSKKMSVNGGGGGDNLFPVVELSSHELQPLSWREFLMEEEEELVVPAQEEDCELLQSGEMIFPSSMPVPDHFHPEELQMTHINKEKTTKTRENTICSCTRLWDSAPNSEISPLDSLLLNCECLPFWDFPDLQN